MQFTTLKQIEEKLKGIDLDSEPVVFVHSSLFQLGKLDSSLKDLSELLILWVGVNGTLLMPSFSYQNQGDWSAINSKGKTGVLTEYFRVLPGVVRSLHPIHSVSAWGKHAHYFTNEMEQTSFGPKSAFHKLVEVNAINVSIGANFIGGATYLHYAEEHANVPFREFKNLAVNCFDLQNNLIPLRYKYFSRISNAEGEYENDWSVPVDDFVMEKLFAFEKIGLANFMHSRMGLSTKFLLKKLNADPYYCAKFKKFN